MPETTTINDAKIKDYRKEKLRWGWNIVGWWKKDDKHVDIFAVGRNVHKDDCILITINDKSIAFNVDKIKYHSNPPDAYDATLSIMGEVDEG